jgi:ABC-type dipeptide/oligopeptide/nickel transport system permease subunit
MAIARRAGPVDLSVPAPAEIARGTVRHHLRRWLPIGIGALLAAVLIGAAVAAPFIAPLSPSAQFSDAVLKGPGVVERHALGTDEYGRDVLSRIIWGARISLQVGLASVLFAFVIGASTRAIAARRPRSSSCGERTC